MVLKFSDGYYLEGLDYWRLTGIMDDVWVLATPKVRLFDWYVYTDLDEAYEDAELHLEVRTKSYKGRRGNYTVRARLEQEGRQVAQTTSDPVRLGANGEGVFTLNEHIENPDKWTAATPNLYDLTLELLDNRGYVVDQIQTRMGFKETEIIENTFYLNGVPIKLHGINSHMKHPETGHVMDEATIRRDFEILKQFNFNCVRTSHYPPVNRYLELADEYGLYIVDETGDEAHASEYLSDMPEYLPMYLERVQQLVIRDRNYPSVLFWSAGNESGEGENITHVIEEGKRLDSTRFWMYGGNADRHPGEEIIGPRYPSPVELEAVFGMDTVDMRPSFMDQYLSIAGNSGGAMDDYWRVIYRHSRLMGGAIWDFVSPGITEPVRRLGDSSPHRTPVHVMGNARLVDGKDGQGLDLNGHDQWVEVYRTDKLEVTGNELYLHLDVYPRRLNSSSGVFITKGSYQFGLTQYGRDSLEFYLYTDQKQVLRVPLPDNWENHWHNLLAVYDGSEMAIYIDSEVAGTKAASGNIQNFPYPVNIGRDFQAHGQDLSVYLADAIIDNVGIYTQAMTPGEAKTSDETALWLDFEQEAREGDFFSYGIGARTYGAIWPDRRVQPEMWQMKKSVQPLSFSLLDLETGLFEVWNRSNFASADTWKTTWTLTEDEQVLQSGELELDAGPQSRERVSIPFSKPDIVPGKEYRLNISSTLREDEIWAKSGFEASWDQFELTEWNEPNLPEQPARADVAVEEVGGVYQIECEGFTYLISKASGELVSMEVDGEEMLVSPLRLNVWRAPFANDMDSWNGGTFRALQWKEGYSAALSTEYYAAGIHDLAHVPLDVEVQQVAGAVKVKVREQALDNGGRTDYSVGERYTNGLMLSGFESLYEYEILGDGTIIVNHEVRPEGHMPRMLPRIGVTLMLDQQYDQVQWYGRGPQENYPDRKTGYRIGIYGSSVEDLYEPYLIPQDHGLRTDNRWVRLTNTEGQGLEFSMNEMFNFSASSYTTDPCPIHVSAATG